MLSSAMNNSYEVTNDHIQLHDA
uniref:Uncharacterized protein n=1 Tax=Anguilla anguilla TaxID=7936 RepID=A0A0E9V114_ANGAN